MNRYDLFFIQLLIITLTLIPGTANFNDINIDNIEHIELLIASPSNISIASVAGHMYLLIKEKNDINSLSRVISFVANSGEDERNGINVLSYSLKGLLGKYRTIIQQETLSQMVKRNTFAENRNIYRLIFNFNKKQIKTIINELDKFTKQKNKKRYYFINRNCSSFLIKLINSALDKDKKIKDTDFIDLPLNIARKFYLKGIVKFYYPEYYSVDKNFKQSLKKRKTIIQDILYFIKTENKKNDYPYSIHNSNKILFKNHFNINDYQNLFEYLMLISNSMKNNENKNIFLSKAYEFFILSKNIENYFAYKNYIKEVCKNKKPIPFSFSNTIIKLTGIILKLRNKIKYPNQIEEQMIKSLITKTKSIRKRKSIKPSLSLIKFGNTVNELSFVPYFKYTLLYQDMGDHSLFSLNHNTKIRLLSLKKLLYDRNIHTESCVLEFNKIYKRDKINHKGLFNFGFGFKLLNKQIIDIKNNIIENNIFSGEYILNLFEKNDFLKYINIHLGIGYSEFSYNTVFENHINFNLEFEGKSNIGFFLDDEIRIFIKYEHVNKQIKKFITGTRINLMFSRKSNFIFFSELKYENIFFNNMLKDKITCDFGIVFPFDIIF